MVKELIKKSMFIIALVGVVAIAWNTQVLASITLTANANWLADGSVVVDSNTPLTLTVVNPGSQVQIVVDLYSDSGTVIQSWWKLLFPSHSFTFEMDQVLGIPLADGIYRIQYRYWTSDCPECGSWNEPTWQTIRIYNGPDVPLVLNVGSPSVLNADGSYNVTSNTSLTLTTGDPRAVQIAINLYSASEALLESWWKFGIPLTFKMDKIGTTPLADGTYRILYRYYAYVSGVWTWMLDDWATITVDNTPPVITILNPVDGDVYNPAALRDIEFSAVDISGVTSAIVALDEIGVAVVDGSGFANLSKEKGEARTVTVTAKDRLGWESSDTVTLYHDKR